MSLAYHVCAATQHYLIIPFLVHKPAFSLQVFNSIHFCKLHPEYFFIFQATYSSNWRSSSVWLEFSKRWNGGLWILSPLCIFRKQHFNMNKYLKFVNILNLGNALAFLLMSYSQNIYHMHYFKLGQDDPKLSELSQSPEELIHWTHTPAKKIKREFKKLLFFILFKDSLLH